MNEIENIAKKNVKQKKSPILTRNKRNSFTLMTKFHINPEKKIEDNDNHLKCQSKNSNQKSRKRENTNLTYDGTKKYKEN